jgi:hypothetical protein
MLIGPSRRWAPGELGRVNVPRPRLVSDPGVRGCQGDDSPPIFWSRPIAGPRAVIAISADQARHGHTIAESPDRAAIR